MVVEFLTFDIDPAELEEWLQVEEHYWTRFLERQDGFVKKEIWRPAGESRAVHAVIWWESLGQWHAIPQADLDAVIEAMGPWERTATCDTFSVARQR